MRSFGWTRHVVIGHHGHRAMNSPSDSRTVWPFPTPGRSENVFRVCAAAFLGSKYSEASWSPRTFPSHSSRDASKRPAVINPSVFTAGTNALVTAVGRLPRPFSKQTPLLPVSEMTTIPGPTWPLLQTLSHQPPWGRQMPVARVPVNGESTGWIVVTREPLSHCKPMPLRTPRGKTSAGFTVGPPLPLFGVISQ